MTQFDKSEASNRIFLTWIAIGSSLLIAMLVLRQFSDRFDSKLDLVDMPVAYLIASYCTIGIIFFLLVPGLIRRTLRADYRKTLILVVLAGILMRLTALGSISVLEDDYNRYLWDGAVVASGENPFRYSPDQIFDNPEMNETLTDLTFKAGQVFDHINHPQFSTVYPTVAQAIFTLTYYISPFDLDAWRLVLLLLELGCVAFILLILKRLQRSPLWLTLYWWNPVVIKEISNSAHMEPILMLPVLAAVFLAMQHRWVWSSGLLAVAAGVKIWPALLAAAIWRQVLAKPKVLATCFLLFASLMAVFVTPILLAGLSETSGFVAFGGQWKSSSAIYLVVESFASFITPVWVTEYIKLSLITRLILAATLLITICALCFKAAIDETKLLHRIFLIIAALYILSPSQTPWYFIWIAPFLCFYPIRGLLLAGALIPLHYAYFYFAPRDMADIYHQGVVWLIWLPVWGLLLFDALKGFWKSRQKQGQKQGRNLATG